jgi:hypothetical protein
MYVECMYCMYVCLRVFKWQECWIINVWDCRNSTVVLRFVPCTVVSVYAGVLFMCVIPHPPYMHSCHLWIKGTFCFRKDWWRSNVKKGKIRITFGSPDIVADLDSGWWFVAAVSSLCLWQQHVLVAPYKDEGMTWMCEPLSSRQVDLYLLKLCQRLHIHTYICTYVRICMYVNEVWREIHTTIV